MRQVTHITLSLYHIIDKLSKQIWKVERERRNLKKEFVGERMEVKWEI